MSTLTRFFPFNLSQRGSIYLLAAMLTAAVLSGCPQTKRSLGHVPEFQLTSEQNQPFGSQELKGTPYLISFFFSSCVTICPKILKSVKKLQTRIIEERLPLHLLSITVDPETDTPEKLKEYGKNIGAIPEHWTFLTANETKLKDFIVNDLRSYVGEREDLGNNLFEIGHGAKLILVDGAGEVRGYFDTTTIDIKNILLSLKQITR